MLNHEIDQVLAIDAQAADEYARAQGHVRLADQVLGAGAVGEAIQQYELAVRGFDGTLTALDALVKAAVSTLPAMQQARKRAEAQRVAYRAEQAAVAQKLQQCRAQQALARQRLNEAQQLLENATDDGRAFQHVQTLAQQAREADSTLEGSALEVSCQAQERAAPTADSNWGALLIIAVALIGVVLLLLLYIQRTWILFTS